MQCPPKLDTLILHFRADVNLQEGIEKAFVVEDTFGEHIEPEYKTRNTLHFKEGLRITLNFRNDWIISYPGSLVFDSCIEWHGGLTATSLYGNIHFKKDVTLGKALVTHAIMGEVKNWGDILVKGLYAQLAGKSVAVRGGLKALVVNLYAEKHMEVDGWIEGTYGLIDVASVEGLSLRIRNNPNFVVKERFRRCSCKQGDPQMVKDSITVSQRCLRVKAAFRDQPLLILISPCSIEIESDLYSRNAVILSGGNIILKNLESEITVEGGDSYTWAADKAVVNINTSVTRGPAGSIYVGSGKSVVIPSGRDRGLTANTPDPIGGGSIVVTAPDDVAVAAVALSGGLVLVQAGGTISTSINVSSKFELGGIAILNAAGNIFGYLDASAQGRFGGSAFLYAGGSISSLFLNTSGKGFAGIIRLFALGQIDFSNGKILNSGKNPNVQIVTTKNAIGLDNELQFEVLEAVFDLQATCTLLNVLQCSEACLEYRLEERSWSPIDGAGNVVVPYPKTVSVRPVEFPLLTKTVCTNCTKNSNSCYGRYGNRCGGGGCGGGRCG